MNIAPLTPEEQITNLSVGGALVYRRPGFISLDDAAKIMTDLSPNGASGIDWARRQVNVYGWKDERRLTAFYGDDQTSYRYSGRDNPCCPWVEEQAGHLTRLKEALGEALAPLLDIPRQPNFCLLNYYGDGSQCIGKHADDERDLTPPIIASISLGADRPLRFSRPNSPLVDVAQPPGTLVVMAGRTQQVFKHEVPPTKKATDPRINLTFRFVKSAPQLKT
jgi:alkylated DNA repair dioxygenase AlkB